MKRVPKRYVPVGPFEKATGICPLYIAGIVKDELQRYFQTDFSDAVCDELAARAEWILAHNPYWRRKFMGRQGRCYLISFMRHWLSGKLSRTAPRLFEQLPDSYKIGRPLPVSSSRSRTA